MSSPIGGDRTSSGRKKMPSALMRQLEADQQEQQQQQAAAQRQKQQTAAVAAATPLKPTQAPTMATALQKTTPTRSPTGTKVSLATIIPPPPSSIANDSPTPSATESPNSLTNSRKRKIQPPKPFHDENLDQRMLLTIAKQQRMAARQQAGPMTPAQKAAKEMWLKKQREASSATASSATTSTEDGSASKKPKRTNEKFYEEQWTDERYQKVFGEGGQPGQPNPEYEDGYSEGQEEHDQPMENDDYANEGYLDDSGELDPLHYDSETGLNEVPDANSMEEEQDQDQEPEEEDDEEDLLAHLPSISASSRSRTLPPESIVLILYQKVSLNRTEYWTFPYGNLTNPIVNTLCTLNGWGMNSREALLEVDTLWGSREEMHIGWRDVEGVIEEEEPLTADLAMQLDPAIKIEPNSLPPLPPSATTSSTTQPPLPSAAEVAAAVAAASSVKLEEPEPAAAPAPAPTTAAPTLQSQPNDGSVSATSNTLPPGPPPLLSSSSSSLPLLPLPVPVLQNKSTPLLRRFRRTILPMYLGATPHWKRVAALQFDPALPGASYQPVKIQGHVAMVFQISVP